MAGFKTLEELNTAFWAWAELEYNKKIHSSTGQAPDERFIKGLPENHRRIKDIENFNAMFLWKDTRKVSRDSVNYLTRLREKYLESQKKSENMRFSKLFEEKEDNND